MHVANRSAEELVPQVGPVAHIFTNGEEDWYSPSGGASVLGVATTICSPIANGSVSREIGVQRIPRSTQTSMLSFRKIARFIPVRSCLAAPPGSSACLDPAKYLLYNNFHG